MELTPDQTLCLERTRKAIVFHRDLAAACDQAHLGVLAREHHYAAQMLDEKLELQLRQLRFDEFQGPVVRK